MLPKSADDGEGTTTVIGDSNYGAADNFAAGQQKGQRTHMALLLQRARDRHPEKVRLFGEKDFTYDAESDLRLPGGGAPCGHSA